MWIKFAGELRNFGQGMDLTVVENDMGAEVRLKLPDGTFLIEGFSTPRAGQDRFNALYAMLTGQQVGVSK